MTVHEATIESLLSGLREQSVQRDIPATLAETASDAVLRAFPQMRGRVISAAERRRVQAYFNAVLRRRVIRGREGRHAASRAVLRAVVADLRSAGCGCSRIVEELERGWRGQVPDEVLDEVRLRLVS